MADLRRRLDDARGYLRIDAARTRLVELEKQASDPSLWDDPEAARKVTTELSRVKDDVDRVDALETRLSDAETLDELAREEGDESLEGEIAAALAELDRAL
ncbi:MAG TPA: PCRF domain-containing protein, partial [Acidimicrobiia bacterium]|nr:PCRF domain-containing protein [Acidimicrobiia bacterium]